MARDQRHVHCGVSARADIRTAIDLVLEKGFANERLGYALLSLSYLRPTRER